MGLFPERMQFQSSFFINHLLPISRPLYPVLGVEGLVTSKISFITPFILKKKEVLPVQIRYQAGLALD